MLLTAVLFQTDVVESHDLPAHTAVSPGAQSQPNLKGCVDSPEAATGILLVVGTVGLLLGTRLMQRLRDSRARLLPDSRTRNRSSQGVPRS